MTGMLPIIDVAPLFGRDAAARRAVADAIGRACRDNGFFYATGHGVDASRLDALAREFFALPQDEKMRIAMARGGRAWRGYFPVGGELTSGQPDRKEGLYFGSELPASDPRVKDGLPLHGANQFPARPAGLRAAVLDYLESNTRAAHAIMEGIALSLGLEAQYFHEHYTGDPTILFRIFHYPPDVAGSAQWGVGEHTDYGLLTLLAQDDCGGLQGEITNGLDRGAADSRHAGVQYRRHARPADRRALPLDAASRQEHQRTRAPVVSILLRSGIRGADRAAARTRTARPGRSRDAMGRGKRACVLGDIWRISPGQSREGVSRAEARCDRVRRQPLPLAEEVGEPPCPRGARHEDKLRETGEGLVASRVPSPSKI
ncbi:MAG: 2-oxoglutarate and iron-dependent oxygenase domain-containing protein [Rhizomicrobium sp.]